MTRLRRAERDSRGGKVARSRFSQGHMSVCTPLNLSSPARWAHSASYAAPMGFSRERFMASTYGYSAGEWAAARDWTTHRLQKVARSRATITYSDLATEMAQAGLVRVEPHSSALAALLGHVNLLEYEDGRPLLSALVIYRGGDAEPGPGFWKFAKDLGIDVGVGPYARLLNIGPQRSSAATRSGVAITRRTPRRDRHHRSGRHSPL